MTTRRDLDQGRDARRASRRQRRSAEGHFNDHDRAEAGSTKPWQTSPSVPRPLLVQTKIVRLEALESGEGRVFVESVSYCVLEV